LIVNECVRPDLDESLAVFGRLKSTALFFGGAVCDSTSAIDEVKGLGIIAEAEKEIEP
jgi:hypothetical protein